MLYRIKLVLPIFALLLLLSCLAKPLANTPLPQITSTVVSSPSLSIVPLLTTTSSPVPTLTAIPTLSPENAYLKLEDFLKNDCRLPCWAGITPGETPLIDASRTMSSFKSISNWYSLGELGGEIGMGYPKGEFIVDFFVKLLSSKDENRVQLLNISTQAFRKIGEGSYQLVYDAQPYHKLLAAYSLQSVLVTYGKPSEIYMTVEIYDTEPGAPDFVMLWLMCPEKGFIAKYTANAEVVDGIVHGCPSKTFVELWLFSPYSNEKYKEDLLPFDMELGYVLPMSSIRTKPISEGIDMSLDEFYQLFSKLTNQCLETPRSKWPEF